MDESFLQPCGETNYGSFVNQFMNTSPCIWQSISEILHKLRKLLSENIASVCKCEIMYSVELLYVAIGRTDYVLCTSIIHTNSWELVHGKKERTSGLCIMLS